MGRGGQCWLPGKSLVWVHPDYPRGRTFNLSGDHKKIFIGRGGNYSVSFSIDMCADECSSKYVEIGIQTGDSHKKRDRFICHIPVPYENALFTASSSGIFIPVHSSNTELMLTLLSPSSVKIKQASISIMEVLG